MPHNTTRSGRGELLAATLGVVTASLCAQTQCTNPWVPSPGVPGVNGPVTDTLVFDPDGAGPLGERVLVAGAFTAAGDVAVSNLAVYDPAAHTWSAFGAATNPAYLKVAQTSNGDIFIGGNFPSIGGAPIAHIARWDGSNWAALGSGVNGAVTQLEALPGSGLLVSGTFTTAGGGAVPNLAVWNGTAWSAISPAPFTGASISALVAHPGSGLTIAAIPSGTYTEQVLHFDGTNWSSIGGGSAIADLLVSPSGDLYATGTRVPSGGYNDRVARWDGANWTLLLGADVYYPVEMAWLPSGHLALFSRDGAIGRSDALLWDGTSWLEIGTTNSNYGSLSVLGNGELLVGGDFLTIDGVPTRSVARWNGAWSQTNPGLTGYIRSVATRPDGATFVAWGSVLPGIGCVLRWNGVSWTNIGGGFDGGSPGFDLVSCMLATSNGSLFIGGRNSGGLTQVRPVVQRWVGAGSAWATIATTGYAGRVEAMAELPDGDLIVGGSFQDMDGVAATNVARFDGTSWHAMGSGLPLYYGVKAVAVSPTGEPHALTQNGVFRWDGSHWLQLGLATGGAATAALVFDHQGAPIVTNLNAGLAEVLRWNGSAWVGLVDAAGNGPGGAVQSLGVLPDGDVVAGPLVNSSNPSRPVQRWNGSAWSPLGGDVDATVTDMALAHNGDLLLAGAFALANGELHPSLARVTTSCPAPVLALGASCYYGTTLEYSTAAWLGATCRTWAWQQTANSISIVAFGTTPLAAPLASLTPIPSYGCQLLLVPEALQLAVPIGNRFSIDFAVPDNPALIGATIREQMISALLDASTGAITQLRASNALQFQIGSF